MSTRQDEVGASGSSSCASACGVDTTIVAWAVGVDVVGSRIDAESDAVADRSTITGVVGAGVCTDIGPAAGAGAESGIEAGVGVGVNAVMNVAADIDVDAAGGTGTGM